MAFVTLQGADSQQHTVSPSDTEFRPHVRCIAVDDWNAVWNDCKSRLADPELRGELAPRCPGDHDGVIGLTHCPTQRNAPAQRFPNLETAMHGDDMRKIHQSRGGGAVHRHGEFVAVNCVDPVLTKKIHQTSHAPRIDWSPQPEYL